MGSYRDYVKTIQEKRAEKMISNTVRCFRAVEAGSTVRVPIETFDRGRTDPKNFLAVVMSNNDGRYKLGTPSCYYFLNYYENWC